MAEVKESGILIQDVETKNIMTKSTLPVGGYSVNPYVGCTHGCKYCYASFMKRFTGHTEPWGTFLDVKHWPAIKNPQKYKGQRVVIGSVTDGYLPQEAQFQNTRKLLEPVDMEKYEFIRLNIREKWVVLMKSDDPLSKKETVSAKDLSVLPLILPRRMNVQSELASWFGNYYEKLDIVFTSNLSTNSAIMVNGGLAYSLVIEGAVPFWNQSKVTFRPLDPPLTATSVLAWKRGQPFSLATTKFIKHIQCFLGMDKP